MDAQLHPRIDVIIPTANIDTWPAAQSVKHNTETARHHSKNIRIIIIESSGPDFSFAKSVNKGLEQVREEAAALLLNDDCFLDAGWPRAFSAAMNSHPEAGIFGALLRFPPGMHGNGLSGRLALNHRNVVYQHAGGFIPVTEWEIFQALFRFAFWRMAPLWVLRNVISTETGLRFPGHHHKLVPRQRIHLITAAAMLITPETLAKIGYFDERYPLAFEDTDYCLRALEAGIRPCLVSDATGQHYESLTTRRFEAVKRASFRTFCEQWPLMRIQEAIRDEIGIVHPKYCGCAEWIE